MAAGKPPSVAVLNNFDSTGLTAWWSGYNFDPGAALANVFTDKLVSTRWVHGDRSDALQSVLREPQPLGVGQRGASTQAQIGRLTGATT